MPCFLSGRFAAAAAVLLAVTACTTPVQRQYSEFNDRLLQTQQNVDACLDAAARKSEWIERLPKAMHTQPAPLAKLSDDSLISDSERVALLDHHEAEQPCRAMALAEYGAFAPNHAELYRTFFALSDMTSARLISREITWGEANRQALQHYTAAEADWLDLNQQIAQRVHAMHTAEVLRVQRDIQAVQDWSRHQQILNSAARPTYTNCQMIGSAISCSQF